MEQILVNAQIFNLPHVQTWKNCESVNFEFPRPGAKTRRDLRYLGETAALRLAQRDLRNLVEPRPRSELSKLQLGLTQFEKGLSNAFLFFQ